mmetsp:Transcript_68979/g.165535  ORF Transcript_68979/g.165535 Transcript_68979/m.165535 type:complete len:214 (+) Transcript_68979:64-705(+)
MATVARACCQESIASVGADIRDTISLHAVTLTAQHAFLDCNADTTLGQLAEGFVQQLDIHAPYGINFAQGVQRLEDEVRAGDLENHTLFIFARGPLERCFGLSGETFTFLEGLQDASRPKAYREAELTLMDCGSFTYKGLDYDGSHVLSGSCEAHGNWSINDAGDAVSLEGCWTFTLTTDELTVTDEEDDPPFAKTYTKQDMLTWTCDLPLYP